MGLDEIRKYIEDAVLGEQNPKGKEDAKTFCDGFLCGLNEGKIIDDEQEEKLRVWLMAL